MPKTLNPAEYVVAEFGGQRELCRALEAVTGSPVYDSTVSRWRKNTRRADIEAGYIPPKWHRPILRAAQKRGLNVTAAHLIEGGNKGELTKRSAEA